MDGILIVNKPQGLTSHDVVDLIRRKFAFKKVGHAGTLDPMATGVLVILIGKYTKSSSKFLNDDKEYDATLVLGATSDTLDAWGKIVPTGGFSGPGPENGILKEIFKKFTGPIEQMPPAYSAVKYKGKKLYQLARKGIEVRMEPRKVTIKSLEISSIDGNEVSFKVLCSKGTYVRQLASDIGAALGCGAYLSKLCRTRSGKYGIREAVSMDELNRMDGAELEQYVKP